MPGYETLVLNVPVGTQSFRLKSLRDRQQYVDRDGSAARLGISSATWPLFGLLWPASLALAEAMSVADVDGRRILEIGCGLALPSLVLKRRGADITASDHHPLAKRFLDFNAALNCVPPIDFVAMPWEGPISEIGHFDIIIGSDVLYERGHAELLAELVDRLSEPRAEVWISCPGRGYLGRFSRALQARGFRGTQKRLREQFMNGELEFRGRLLRYRRGDARRPQTVTFGTRSSRSGSIEPRAIRAELPALRTAAVHAKGIGCDGRARYRRKLVYSQRPSARRRRAA